MDNLTLLFPMLLLFLSLLMFFVALIQPVGKQLINRKNSFTLHVETELSHLFVLVNPHLLVRIQLTLTIFVPLFLMFFSGNIPLSIIAFIMLYKMPFILIALMKKKRLQQFEQQLPDALMQVAGSIKSGASFLNAIDMLSEHTKGPLAQEFGLVVREYRLGTSIEHSLENLEKRIPSENFSLVVTTIVLAQETGGSLSDNIERLAQSIRQKLMIERKIKALTSQGKLQGIVVGLLPIGIALILMQLEPIAMGYLFHSWLGYATLAAIVVLEALGLVFIRKIINIDI